MTSTAQSAQPEALRLADFLDSYSTPNKRAAAAELRRQHAEIEQLRSALLDCARKAEALKMECRSDPESPQAVRNGQYQAISTAAHIALGTIRGPAPVPALGEPVAWYDAAAGANSVSKHRPMFTFDFQDWQPTFAATPTAATGLLFAAAMPPEVARWLAANPPVNLPPTAAPLKEWQPCPEPLPEPPTPQPMSGEPCPECGLVGEHKLQCSRRPDQQMRVGLTRPMSGEQGDNHG